jgi:hypothetical protein
MLRSYIGKIFVDDDKIKGPNSKAFKDEMIKLDSMIGLDYIKNKVVKHVNHAIAEMNRGVTEENFHNVMITGEQGRGKTELAMVIGRIFTALGYFNRGPKREVVKVPMDIMELDRIFSYICKKSTERVSKRKTIKSRSSRKGKNTSIAGHITKLHVPLKDVRKINGISKTYRSKILSYMTGIGVPKTEEYIDGYLNDRYENTCIAGYESPPSIDTTIMSDYIFSISDKSLPCGICKVYGKSDVVAGYVGQTSGKCKDALLECKGGAFILDEAYSLLNGKCSFGLEALNTINQYMSEHPIDQMIIFLGYKDMIKVLYENQRGLYRRFNWVYNIEDYTPIELSQIYLSSIPNGMGDNLDRSDVEKLFKKEKEVFYNGAGDCINLKQYSIIEMDWDKKDKIDMGHVELGISILKKKKGELDEPLDVRNNHMYL